MIDQKRKGEIRRVIQNGYIPSLDQSRDLLFALEELEADNAELLSMLRETLVGLDCLEPKSVVLGIGSQIQFVLGCEHPGTALLVRHEEELKAKDGEIARLQQVHAACDDALDCAHIANRDLKSSLARTRTALRKLALWSRIHTAQSGCDFCNAEWPANGPERHNPIDGQPCPAEEEA